MARFPRPQPQDSAPSRADRLASMQQNDIDQQRADSTSQEALMNMFSQLYGIGQQASLLPEHLRQLQLGNDSTAALLPGQVQHQNLQNEGMQFENAQAPQQAALKYNLGQSQVAENNAQVAHMAAQDSAIPAQVAHLGAETDAMHGKGMGSIQHLMLGEQAGLLPPGTTKAAMMSFLPPEARGFMDQAQHSATQKKFAGYEDLARQGGIPLEMDSQVTNEFGPDNLSYLHSLGTPSTHGVKVNPDFINDPQIQALLQQSKKGNDFYKQLPTQIERRNVERQVHPVRGFFKDLYDLL